MIYSGSRTAYLGLISLLLWWFFQSRKKRRFLAIATAVCILAVPLIPDQYIERFKSIGGKEAEGHSKLARKQVMNDALVVFMENPLGIGVGSFPVVRAARFGREAVDTHNLYLEVATNLGVQGLVAFLGLVGVLLASFRDSARAFRGQQLQLIRLAGDGKLPAAASRHARRHFQDLAFCYAMAQATAGYILVRLVLGFFGMDLYEIYWWVGAGIAVSLAGLVTTTRKRTRFIVQVIVTEDESRRAAF
ncbi:MAG: O-antigen ligase family protein [Betaproteobacteria bacterium]|nr:O-antigen ligase family protein [Betaproteobacteria bacterium]